MTVVNTAETMPYSVEQMFELVNDVESYPAFLPWCRSARVTRHGERRVAATLTVAKGPLQHSFTTENRLHPHERIEMSLLEGPFRRFHGMWRFEPVGDGCRVALDLEFEFSSRLLASAMSKVFKMLTGSMVAAFRDRARQLYG